MMSDQMFVNCGPDDLNTEWEYCNDSLEGIRKIFYSYECGCYEGDGIAVALLETGECKMMNLGHCSCFGPTESKWSDPMFVEEFIAGEDSEHPHTRRSEEDCDWHHFKAVRDALQKELNEARQ